MNVFDYGLPHDFNQKARVGQDLTHYTHSAYELGWHEPCEHTVDDRMYGNFPAYYTISIP
jgi:hypothetical protein